MPRRSLAARRWAVPSCCVLVAAAAIGIHTRRAEAGRITRFILASIERACPRAVEVRQPRMPTVLDGLNTLDRWSWTWARDKMDRRNRCRALK